MARHEAIPVVFKMIVSFVRNDEALFQYCYVPFGYISLIIFRNHFTGINKYIWWCCDTIYFSIPSKLRIIGWETALLKNNLTPTIENPERFDQFDAFAPYNKHIIDAIAIWCKGIWNEDLFIIEENLYAHGVTACTTILVLGFNIITSIFFD